MMGWERPGAAHPNTGARKWRGCRAVWGGGIFTHPGLCPGPRKAPKRTAFRKRRALPTMNRETRGDRQEHAKGTASPGAMTLRERNCLPMGVPPPYCSYFPSVFKHRVNSTECLL